MAAAESGADVPAGVDIVNEESSFGEPRPLTGSARPLTAMSDNDVSDQSEYLVARVMSATEKRIERILSAGSRASSATRPLSAVTTYSDMEGASSEKWQLAEDVVASIITEWVISDRWKYCINRIGKVEEKFLFEAIFSSPTRRRPIPNATASVLFAVDLGSSQDVALPIETPPVSIEISAAGENIEDNADKIVNQVLTATETVLDTIVAPPMPASTKLRKESVLFSMESQDLVQDARTGQFQEKWLHDILAAKRNLFQVAASILD